MATPIAQLGDDQILHRLNGTVLGLVENLGGIERTALNGGVRCTTPHAVKTPKRPNVY